MLNNFYLKHFFIQYIFLAASSLKVNLASHFYTLHVIFAENAHNVTSLQRDEKRSWS